METDHQNTFQPTENRYSSLGGEEFQPEKPDVTGKCQRIYFDGQRTFETLLSANVPDDVSFGHRRLNGV